MQTSFPIDDPRFSPDMSGKALCSPLIFRRGPETLEKPPLIPPKFRTGRTGLSTLTLPLNATTIAPSPKTRPNICGFSPLPSITASPICTPTSSLSSQTQNEASSSSINTNTKDDSSSSSSSEVQSPPTPPTWISTPPTPPSKAIRRSNTMSARRSTFSAVPPSTSFPVSMHTPPRGNLFVGKSLKRSTSDPTLSPRLPVLTAFTSFLDDDLVQSPRAISTTMENPFDATFSHIADGIHGPDFQANLFRVANDEVFDKSSRSSADEPSPEGSWSDHDSLEAALEAEKNKDNLRRYHALKELLATELGYLADLKALVSVYLRNLPTLAVRTVSVNPNLSRSTASFAAGPWVPSYTQLQAAAVSSSATLPETLNSSYNYVKEPYKPRYIFSDADLETLTRNGEDILQLHEHFARELNVVLEPLGMTMDPHLDSDGYPHLHNLDNAIHAVSAKYATEASRFKAYQSFCAGHPEALDIIRKAYQQYPLELDSFEQRCATMISDMEAGSKPTVSEPQTGPHRDSEHLLSQKPVLDDRKRAKSSSSLDGAVRSLRRRPSMLNAKDATSPPEPKRERSSPRIVFTDYLIKPIQRVCKYPLLLDQLLPSKAFRVLSNTVNTRSDVDVVVESAAQAMRHVAASVDEARRRQDIATQSALISSRIHLSSSSGSTSPSGQTLTPEFLASLGNCLLAGSLDSMYYHPDRPLGQMSTIKAKYYGAFLYPGGYIILVKVSKGRKYEPRHWFSLADFEVDDEGSLLPCSFKLSCGERQFEFAAACQREKETWLSSIRESFTHPAAWVNEPLPSFKYDEKGELLPELEERFFDEPSLTGLPTIRSIPEMSHTEDTEIPEPFFASLRVSSKTKKKKGGYETPFYPKPDMPPPPTRRSSAQSVKSIFSPMTSDPETLLIRRSSPAARLQVDQELQDVVSRSIITARSHAFTHELELFQAPKTTKSGFTRSNSGISMSRLSKHESVRVPRRRTSEGLDGSLSKRNTALKSSTGSRRIKSKKLSITSVDSSWTSGSQESTELGGPSSQSSSRSTSVRTPGTATSSIPLPSPSPLPNTELSPLKSRSFVRNVKGIFQLRPVSPNSSAEAGNASSLVSITSSEQHIEPQSMLHRWTRDSFRRRTRSVPDEPDRRSAAFDGPEDPYTISPSRTNVPLSTS